MEQKIQLRHPAGKHADRMYKGKYDTIKKALMASLKKWGELTHTELLLAITENFSSNKIKFDGSVEWHMQSVKLDLEANNIIERVFYKTVPKFRLVK